MDKTSNLHQRLERYFGGRSELVKDLDLREITSRIEFLKTSSSFETTYALYVQRREYFPKTYRKMRTFRLFKLMKINRRQRFPRIYASTQIKAGVDYFGPFETRGQFTRLKTTLERTFRLRPCLYNIRGNDPHPDCLYFQMHTCSRPCNNDISRERYLVDIDSALAFIEGREDEIRNGLLEQIMTLSDDQRFEEAEVVRKQLDRIDRARHESKDTFPSVWTFDFLVLLPSDSVTRTKIAFVRAGAVIGFEEFDSEALAETLPQEILHRYSCSPPAHDRDWQYDEFCLVAHYLLHPLKTVELVKITKDLDLTSQLKKRKRRKKSSPLL